MLRKLRRVFKITLSVSLFGTDTHYGMIATGNH